MNFAVPENLLEDRLPDWWRPMTVTLEGRVEILTDTIQKLASVIDAQNAQSLVAYAFGDDSAGEKVIGQIREVAREFDASYAHDLGDVEPPAIAAAAIAHRLTTEPDSTTDLLALTACSSSWTGTRPVIRDLPLLEYANAILSTRASSVRSPQFVSPSPSVVSTINGLAKEIPQLAEGASPTSEEVMAGFNFAHNATQKLAHRIDTIARRVHDEQTFAREQLQLQTWLLDEWGADATEAWSDLSNDIAPIAVAVDLAALTNYSVPLPNYEALIAGALAKCGLDANTKLKPIEVIQASYERIELDLDETAIPSVMPLLNAAISMRVGKSKARQSLGAHGGQSARTALVFAGQTYREILASKLLRNE